MNVDNEFDALIASIVLQFFLTFLSAWFVMLGLDVANDHWRLPDIGYWGCFALTLGVSALSGAVRGMRTTVKG